MPPGDEGGFFCGDGGVGYVQGQTFMGADMELWAKTNVYEHRARSY
ncbi:hypothetical protein OXB_1460 [Bacillus sp. OxB-1]|nr:hypothetical protein OXB_1460 [Bacillus sp. OxB-1]